MDTKKKKNKSGNGHEVAGIVCIVISAFFLICLITPLLSDIGTFIKNLTTGLLGYLSYPVALCLLLVGVLLLLNKKPVLTSKQIALVILMAICAVFILQTALDSAKMNGSFGGYLGSLISFDSANTTAGRSVGGVIFGIFAYGIKAVLTFVGAYILYSVLFVLFGVLLILDVRSGVKESVVRQKKPEPVPFVKGKSVAQPVRDIHDNSLFVGTIEKNSYTTETGDFASIYSPTPDNVSRYDTVDSVTDDERENAKKILMGNTEEMFKKYESRLKDEMDIKDHISGRSNYLIDDDNSYRGTSANTYGGSSQSVYGHNDYGQSAYNDAGRSTLPDVPVPPEKDISSQIVYGPILNGEEVSRSIQDSRRLRKPPEEDMFGFSTASQGVEEAASVELPPIITGNPHKEEPKPQPVATAPKEPEFPPIITGDPHREEPTKSQPVTTAPEEPELPPIITGDPHREEPTKPQPVTTTPQEPELPPIISRAAEEEKPRPIENEFNDAPIVDGDRFTKHDKIPQPERRAEIDFGEPIAADKPKKVVRDDFEDDFDMLLGPTPQRPTEQVRPTEEILPTEQVQPTEQVRPTEEILPTEQTQPTEQVQPMEQRPTEENVSDGTEMDIDADRIWSDLPDESLARDENDDEIERDFPSEWKIQPEPQTVCESEDTEFDNEVDEPLSQDGLERSETQAYESEETETADSEVEEFTAPQNNTEQSEADYETEAETSRNEVEKSLDEQSEDTTFETEERSETPEYETQEQGGEGEQTEAEVETYDIPRPELDDVSRMPPSFGAAISRDPEPTEENLLPLDDYPEEAESDEGVEDEDREPIDEETRTPKIPDSLKLIDEEENRSETGENIDKNNNGYYVTEDPDAKFNHNVKEISLKLKDNGMGGKASGNNQINMNDYVVDMPDPKPKKKKHTRYNAPPIDLLMPAPPSSGDELENCQENAERLEDVLHNLKVDAKVINITRGPAVTRYELEMPLGQSVKRIPNCADDIAYALASDGAIRIEAPISGKRAVGVEVPNKVVSLVSLREIIDSNEFRESKSCLTMALGKDIGGDIVLCNLEKMPHLLIAGATGSGKSACLNSIIISFLYKASPDDVRLILIDPKQVEFGLYRDMPHLLMKNIINDSTQAINAFKWAREEMDRRYTLFAKYTTRNLADFNESPAVKTGTEPRLPRIVIIVDELAELMLAKNSKELEQNLMSMAQKARAAGIHLILATQRPSVDVLTGTIKANFTSRIAFAVKGLADSRTILDYSGAETLLGRGDMLYAPIGVREKRVQGAFVDTPEVESIVNYVRENNEADYDEEAENIIMRRQEEIAVSAEEDGGKEVSEDPLMKEVLRKVIETGQASASQIQRRFSVGYNRASRIIDQMEENGYIGPLDGQKSREVYITREKFIEIYGEDIT